MYSEKVEKLIELALVDGVLTDKKRQVLMKTAEAEGIDSDEFEMVLEARLYKIQHQDDTEETFSKRLSTEEKQKGGIFDNFHNKIIGRQAYSDYKKAKKNKT
jgi:adenylate kinase family enzyme